MNRILVIVFIFCQFNLFADGWPRPKGTGFFMFSQRVIIGSNFFNRDGTIVKSPNLSALTTNFYGEYGLSNRLSAKLYAPFLTSLKRDAGMDENGMVFIEDEATGFGDLDLSLEYTFLQGNINLSAELAFGLATGDYNAGTTESLHLGDGENSQMLKMHASKGFNNNVFASVFVGVNNRTAGFNDEIHFGGEVGITKNKLVGILKVYVRKSFFNEGRKDSPIPGLYSDNIEYVSFSPQVLYNINEQLGLLFEAGFAPVSRNIIAAPSLTFGVYWDLKK